MSPDEFAAKIKAKYPDYANVDNRELSRRIVDKHPEYASQVDFNDAPNDNPRQSADSGEALITNLPTSGFGQDFVRGLPATVGALVGGVAGLPGGPLGVVAGSALGGAAGEAVRQGVSNMTAAAFPEQNYPINSPRQVVSNVVSQGVSQGAGAGVGLGVGAGLSAARPGINRVGAGVLKIAAGIPENVGRQVMENPSVLLGTPTRDAVSGLYDAYHKASGTVSRKASIMASDTPSEVGMVSRAIKDLDEATVALRNGTLTEQQAVNASQAGRIVADARREGQELAMQSSEFAQTTKEAMDDFIARGRGPRTEIQSVPVAQQIERETTPIASRLEHKSDVYHSATTLNPEQVNVPTDGAQDLLPDLRRVVDMVNRAKGNGLSPKSIMTESERALYDQFRQAVESSAEHGVPIETLLTKGEMSAPTSGFAERTVLREGEPIYAGANRYEFGGTVDKVSYRPGEVIMGNRPVELPAQPGYPEWQTARDAARKNYLSEEMGQVLPQNKGNSVNVLRPWQAATVGAGLGTAVGGPIGGVVGAGMGLAATSPLAYRTALQGAAMVGKVPGVVYRVGTQAAAGTSGSSLADYYGRLNNRLPVADPSFGIPGAVRPNIP